MTALQPRELEGVRIDPSAPIRHCGSCAAEIWWGFTRAGKRNPFDIVDGVRTAITHWSTCPRVEVWRKH